MVASAGVTLAYKRRREVELKHGPALLLATIGYIVPEYTRLPGL